MRWYRRLVEAMLLLLAVVLQVGLLSRLGLPGATPDLVLVFVVALALQRGPLIGCVYGFGAGLMLDLTPPSTGVLGVTALLLLLIGYAAGRAKSDEHAILRPLAVVSVSAVFLVIGYALIAGLVDRRSLDWHSVPLVLVTEVLYCLILATFVIPGLAWVERRMVVLQEGPFRGL